VQDRTVRADVPLTLVPSAATGMAPTVSTGAAAVGSLATMGADPRATWGLNFHGTSQPEGSRRSLDTSRAKKGGLKILGISRTCLQTPL